MSKVTFVRMEDTLQNDWQSAVVKLEAVFGEGLDLQAILYLIGLQELGKGPIKLSKDQKLDVIHIAVCTLLGNFGYYEFKGEDAEGWPHYERNQKLPFLKPAEQELLIKKAIIEYIHQAL